MLSHAKSYYKSLSRTTRLMILGCSLIKDDERSPLVKHLVSHTRVLRPTPSCSRASKGTRHYRREQEAGVTMRGGGINGRGDARGCGGAESVAT
jgi:hypothetical protein